MEQGAHLQKRPRQADERVAIAGVHFLRTLGGRRNPDPSQGHWNINNAPISVVEGRMSKNMMYVAAAVVPYWFLKKKAA